MTPEEVAKEIVNNIPYEPDWRDWEDVKLAIANAIANAKREAYAEAAEIAIDIGYKMHDSAKDPQEDNSDRTGEAISEELLKRTKVLEV